MLNPNSRLRKVIAAERRLLHMSLDQPHRFESKEELSDDKKEDEKLSGELKEDKNEKEKEEPKPQPKDPSQRGPAADFSGQLDEVPVVEEDEEDEVEEEDPLHELPKTPDVAAISSYVKTEALAEKHEVAEELAILEKIKEEGDEWIEKESAEDDPSKEKPLA